ncbi:hypothetical protein WT60_27915 [Burkholderia sp. MSMB617WGS]|nr:hypothetical protein WS86_20785 [Burkholderia savannae]AOK50610.1 hypothetical protein WT60_27915 [Burkholderia sp. MSMB617WGS]KVK75497.1 hypothetical protein WS91_17825 [Burkholderia sp. MSMB1498]KWZ47094.1 hypothetical protein WS73_00300 [Burkholderia savannae]
MLVRSEWVYVVLLLRCLLLPVCPPVEGIGGQQLILYRVFECLPYNTLDVGKTFVCTFHLVQPVPEIVSLEAAKLP